MATTTNPDPFLRRFVRRVFVHNSSYPVERTFPRRVSTSVRSDDGDKHISTGSGQKVMAFFKKCLGDEEKVRAWAAANAYTLIFLTTMFVITWTVFLATSFHWFGLGVG